MLNLGWTGLQWGRNLTVAEGARVLCRGGGGRKLQWGRNLTVAEGFSSGGSGSGPYCFNGAAT